MILTDSKNNILNNMLDKPVILYFSLSFLIISFILFLCRINSAFYILPSITGIIVLIILFTISNESHDQMINPFAIVLIYILFPMFIFSFYSLIKHTKLIFLGLTTKQYVSIQLFLKTNEKLLNEENDLDSNLLKMNNLKL